MTIKINHLTKDYGNNKGIFDVSFDVQDGEVFGFLGPNGAGKTTTIRHLLGFIIPSINTCSINDLDIHDYASEIQKNIGYISGEINLMENMTGKEFINFMKEYRGMKNNGRIEELIRYFELDPQGKIKKMSKGMKQKIAIIVAFMHDPDILILDEPTSGLDPIMQNKFIELILEEKKKGKTILMSSHMIEEVEKTSDRIGIIKDGKIVTISTIDDIRKAKQNIYIIEFNDSNDINLFINEGFDIVTSNDNYVEVKINNDLNDLIKSLSKYNIVNFEKKQLSLEEVFMQFYGGESHD